MDAESIVVSLEMAKKLKEAGWPQTDETLFIWQENVSCPLYSHPIKDKPQVYGSRWTYLEPDCGCQKYAAPTAEEILRELPRTFTFNKESVWLECCPMCNEEHPGWEINNNWLVRYAKVQTLDGENHRRLAYETCEDTLANAAAAMWVFLKEHSLLPE